MQALPQPSDGDRNRAPALLAIFWTPFPVIVALLCVRFFVRIKIKNIGLDDYTMFLALVLLVITNALASVSMLNGGARHFFYLQPEERSYALKYNVLSQPFGALIPVAGKTSIAFFILRILGPRNLWQRWFIYANLAIYWVITIVSVVITLLQCTPTRALWETVLSSKCWSPNIGVDINLSQSSYGTYMDFALALLPITIIKGLNMSFKNKFALCALLGLGVVAGIFAAIKTAYLHYLGSRGDVTWDVYPVYGWAEAESCLVIICGCIPPIKPLFERLVRGKPLRQSRSAYPSKRSYQMHSSSNGSAKKSFVGQSENVTNVTSTIDSGIYSTRPTIKPKGIQVERNIEIVSSDTENGKGISGNNDKV